MEIIAGFQPLFTAGIFLLAFLSLLGVVFNWLLSPLKNNQVRLEFKMDRMESEFKEMESKFTGLESKFTGLESKMDQLLALYKSP